MVLAGADGFDRGLTPDGVLEEAQVVLELEDAADGAVEGGLAEAAFLDELDDIGGEVGGLGDHGHVDAGLDRHQRGFLLIRRDAVDGDEFVDVGPVGDGDALEAQFAPEEVDEDRGVRVDGQPVDLPGVDHDGRRPGVEDGAEGGQVGLEEFTPGHVDRGAVAPRLGDRVSEEVLGGRGDGVVGREGVSLQALDDGGRHDGGEEGILPEGLEDAGPSGLSGEVRDGGEGPVGRLGAGLLGGDLAREAGEFGVEGRAEVEVVGQDGALEQVVGAVDGVVGEDDGDAQARVVDRELLDALDHVAPAVQGERAVPDAEERAHPVLDDDVAELLVADGEGIARVLLSVDDDGDVELGHLARLLGDRHAGEEVVDVLGGHAPRGGEGGEHESGACGKGEEPGGLHFASLSRSPCGWEVVIERLCAVRDGRRPGGSDR